jgi:acetyltransferase-like isoleucine patch superfamily enzyme
MGIGLKTLAYNIYHKIIVFTGDYLWKQFSIYNYQKIKQNQNIQLGLNVKISPTSRIETRYGGSIKIGNGTEILDGVLILTYGGNIEIGENCSINPYTVIYGHGNTFIGNDVLIAGHCMIIPNNHSYADSQIPIRLQGTSRIGISIMDNVWIGHGCTILDGCQIERGVIVAAGSVVRGEIEENTIVAGIPAKVIKKRNNED